MDQPDDRYPLQPLLALPSGMAEVKNPPRVIFARPSEFVRLEDSGERDFLIIKST